MIHDNFKITTDVAERDFREFMQRGDDFFNIQLLRPAKSWYKKALELNSQSDRAKQQIAECDRLLAFEMKVVRILASIVTVLVIAYLLIYCL